MLVLKHAYTNICICFLTIYKIHCKISPVHMGPTRQEKTMKVQTKSETGVTIQVESNVWYGEHPHLPSAVRYFFALINVHYGNRGGLVKKDDINTPIESLFASTGNHYGDYIRKA